MCTATMPVQAVQALPTPPDDGDDFVTLAEASRITRRGVYAIKTIALAGGIRTRWRPGDRVRYSRSDARRHAEAK